VNCSLYPDDYGTWSKFTTKALTETVATADSVNEIAAGSYSQSGRKIKEELEENPALEQGRMVMRIIMTSNNPKNSRQQKKMSMMIPMVARMNMKTLTSVSM
jgi:hypothetical protein